MDFALLAFILCFVFTVILKSFLSKYDRSHNLFISEFIENHKEFRFNPTNYLSFNLLHKRIKGDCSKVGVPPSKKMLTGSTLRVGHLLLVLKNF